MGAGDDLGADARGGVRRADVDQRRLGGVALGDVQRAARPERAAGRQVHQRRRRAEDGRQPLPGGAVQPRQGPQQPERVGHPRLVVDVLDAAHLDRPPGVHDQDPVGHAGHHAEVVGDQHHGRPGLLERGLQHLEDLRLHGDVQGRRGLVGDDHVGLVGHRDRDDDALAHAAGELVRVGPQPVLGLRDADQGEQLGGPGGGGLGRQVPVVDAQRLLDLLPDAVDRVEGGHRVLEDHRDALAADAGHLAVPLVEQLVAAVAHRPGDPRRLRQQAHDGQAGHRLARPGLTDDAEDLAGLQRVVDAPDGVHQAVLGREPHVEVAHGQQRGRRVEPREPGGGALPRREDLDRAARPRGRRAGPLGPGGGHDAPVRTARGGCSGRTRPGSRRRSG
ncbi:hypothetical protein SAMN06893096_10396 [Geodermatophilus pulveris]|uniref:Uncharacterized protein n=1 Tax=Geodermatophilus pulveris TaxID=1564159 RepID=A0A239DBK5_9ACTN|nr:hypothetical protein SAMN06893096_10396 [Geodermatophilus pulveris]